MVFDATVRQNPDLRNQTWRAEHRMVPGEAHGYSAKESTEHTLFEMISWFDKYVKNAKPRNKNMTARQ